MGCGDERGARPVMAALDQACWLEPPAGAYVYNIIEFLIDKSKLSYGYD